MSHQIFVAPFTAAQSWQRLCWHLFVSFCCDASVRIKRRHINVIYFQFQQHSNATFTFVWPRDEQEKKWRVKDLSVCEFHNFAKWVQYSVFAYPFLAEIWSPRDSQIIRLSYAVEMKLVILKALITSNIIWPRAQIKSYIYDCLSGFPWKFQFDSTKMHILALHSIGHVNEFQYDDTAVSVKSIK